MYTSAEQSPAAQKPTDSEFDLCNTIFFFNMNIYSSRGAVQEQTMEKKNISCFHGINVTSRVYTLSGTDTREPLLALSKFLVWLDSQQKTLSINKRNQMQLYSTVSK